MARMELSVNAHVFYSSLRFKTSILVEEKDKKKFLDFALRSQGDPELIILAFAILDNEAQFLLAVRKGKTEAKKLISVIMRNYKKFLLETHCQGKDRGMVKVKWEMIEGEEQILNTCKRIHFLPVEQGYVKRPRDYWWSSFQSYRGTYQWKGIDILPILQCFALNGRTGRSMFLKYHRHES